MGEVPPQPLTVTPRPQEPFQVRGALPARGQVQPTLEQQPEQPKPQRFAKPEQVGVSGARETAEARGVARRGGETEKVREGKQRGGGDKEPSRRALHADPLPVVFFPPFQG